MHRLQHFIVFCLIIGLGCASVTRVAAAQPDDGDRLTPPEIAVAEVDWVFRSTWNLRDPLDPFMVNLSAVTIAKGNAYFGDAEGTLYALDASNGEELWRHESPHRIATAPAVGANRVVFGSEAGLRAVNADTGEMAWQQLVAHGATEADVQIRQGRAYYSAYDGNAYARGLDTGQQLWQASLMEDVPSAPKGFESQRARFQNIVARPNGTSIAGGLLLQSMFDQSRLIALRIDDGSLAWSFATQGWIRPAAVAAGDRIVFGCQDKFVYCLHTESGKLLWKYQTESRISANAAVDDQFAYVASCDGHLHKLALSDGAVQWRFATTPAEPRNTAIYSRPLLSRQAVYVAAGEGQIYAIRRRDGHLLWKLRPSPDSELYTDLETDGQRIFAVVRQSREHDGECALIAIADRRSVEP